MPAVHRKPGGVGRGILAIGLAALLAALSSGPLSGQDSAIFDVAAMRDVKTRDLMTAARVAVFGGPGGVALLRALRFKGRSRFPAEDGSLISATVEIRVLLPDHYLRIDTAPFGRRLNGVSGNTAVNLIERANGQTTQDPSDAKTLLFADRSQLARLMLGVAAYTSPALPVALSTRDTPQAMPGPSDPLGIDATGDHGFEGFVARLVLDAKSRTPGRVVFWDADRTVLTTAFTERRSTGGMKAPYSIVTTAGDRIVDELVFDEVAVNPKLSKTDFSR
jgi:hypothetical protein